MKKKKVPVGQFASETKNLDGPSEEFLEKTAPLIGYIVHSFNTLDESLNSAICDLFHEDADAIGLLVIYTMKYATKVDLFKRFLIAREAHHEKKSPIIKKLVTKLTEAGNLRNKVIHADWESAHDDGYTLCKLKINSKGIQHEYIQFTPESLEKIRELIDETCEMLDEYKQEIYDY